MEKNTPISNCPCCGSDAEMNGYKLHWVECTNEACGIGTKACDTEEEALAIWNTRRPMERIVERLEERYKNHDTNIKENISKKYLDSASRESLMKTESEIAIEIEIVKEER